MLRDHARPLYALLAGALTAAASLTHAAPLTIIGDRQNPAIPETEIIIADNSPAAVQFAAEELQHFLRLLTGVRLPINVSAHYGRQTKKVFLCLPDSPHFANVRDQYASDLAALAGTDGYAVRTSGNLLFLFADCPKGVLNGVYRFLTRNSDLIWPRPDQVGVAGQKPVDAVQHALGAVGKQKEQIAAGADGVAVGAGQSGQVGSILVPDVGEVRRIRQAEEDFLGLSAIVCAHIDRQPDAGEEPQKVLQLLGGELDRRRRVVRDDDFRFRDGGILAVPDNRQGGGMGQRRRRRQGAGEKGIQGSGVVAKHVRPPGAAFCW